MSVAKKLALIAAGYVVAVLVGLAAVALNELRISEDIQPDSGGMVAFGDLILFVLVVGFFSLVPTWFLLRLFVRNMPRALLAILLLIAAIGPAGWLTMMYLARNPGLPDAPQSIVSLLGLFIPLVAVPRIVLGPVLLVIEGVTFLLVRARIVRALLAAAMLMDIVPLSMFALHMARALRY
jgi:hypothetical protein